MADAAEGRRVGASPTARNVGALTVVCLPGGGGPQLAAELRRLGVQRSTGVRALVVVAPREQTPVLLGDPLSGVFWPLEAVPPGDDGPSRADVLRATELRWFLWEMGLSVATEIRRGDPLDTVIEAARRPGTDAVILAAPASRRWRTAALHAARRAGPGSAEIRCALDRPARRLDRFMPARPSAGC